MMVQDIGIVHYWFNTGLAFIFFFFWTILGLHLKLTQAILIAVAFRFLDSCHSFRDPICGGPPGVNDGCHTELHC